jgi:hypothetical protein
MLCVCVWGVWEVCVWCGVVVVCVCGVVVCVCVCVCVCVSVNKQLGTLHNFFGIPTRLCYSISSHFRYRCGSTVERTCSSLLVIRCFLSLLRDGLRRQASLSLIEDSPL